MGRLGWPRFKSYRGPVIQAALSEPTLAERVTDDSPPGLFFMSDDELGLRLAIKSMEAHRILKGRLTKLGVIVVVENGIRRAKGQRGIATTYRWNVAPL